MAPPRRPLLTVFVHMRALLGLGAKLPTQLRRHAAVQLPGLLEAHRRRLELRRLRHHRPITTSSAGTATTAACTAATTCTAAATLLLLLRRLLLLHRLHHRQQQLGVVARRLGFARS